MAWKANLTMCASSYVFINDDFPFAFDSGWRRWVRVCHRCERSHTRRQAYCVAPDTGGRFPLLYAPEGALCCIIISRHVPYVFIAPRFSQLRQQHLYLQGSGWRLGVSGHLARTHVHSLEFGFWCRRTEAGLLQRRPHREDLERVSQRRWTRWVVSLALNPFYKVVHPISGSTGSYAHFIFLSRQITWSEDHVYLGYLSWITLNCLVDFHKPLKISGRSLCRVKKLLQ